MTFGDLLGYVLAMVFVFAVAFVTSQVILKMFPKAGRWIYTVIAIIVWFILMMSILEVGPLEVFDELIWMDADEGIAAVIPIIVCDAALQVSKKWKLTFVKRFNKEDRA